MYEQLNVYFGERLDKLGSKKVCFYALTKPWSYVSKKCTCDKITKFMVLVLVSSSKLLNSHAMGSNFHSVSIS